MVYDKYRSYTAGNFEFLLDGERTGAYVKGVEGGFVKTQVMTEQLNSYVLAAKHASVPEIEPIQLDFGLSSSRGLMTWIQQSWERGSGDVPRHDGQITHADTNYNATFIQSFQQALIAETTFPALDGSAKDPAYMKVKIQPEMAQFSTEPGNQRLTPKSTGTQKYWLPSMFRFKLDGVQNLEYTNKLDSFTIKQTITPHYAGQFRLPTYTAEAIEFPNLSGTISLPRADGLLDWYNNYILAGKEDDPKAQKAGTIEYLSPDLQTTLLTIRLDGVGLYALTLPRSEANSDQIKRVKFDLYVTKMTLEIPGGNYFDLSD